MNIESFNENFGGYQLRGRMTSNTQIAHRGDLFFVPGARSDVAKLDSLVVPLTRLGYRCLTFELSGHALGSGVPTEETSLRVNLLEVERFLLRFGDARPVLVGHSLGGALALKLAERRRDLTERLVLICPAVYPDSAYDVNFGNSFKEQISRPFGFMASSTFPFLHSFTGRALLILGEYDGMRSTDHGGIEGRSAGWLSLSHGEIYSAIPVEVVEAICQSIPLGRIERLSIADCDHHISSYLRSNSFVAEDLVSRIDRFLTDSYQAI